MAGGSLSMLKDYFIAFWRNARLVFSGRLLPARYWIRTLRLAWAYQTVDQHLARLRRRSGLRCVAGCGRCCENVYAETTVLEMLPLAAVLLKRRRVDLWLKKLAALPDEGRCVFYRRDPATPGRGRCSVYPLRPLICRLFGFAAKKSRAGAQIITCGVIKTTFPAELATANRLINIPPLEPLAEHDRDRLDQIDATLAGRMSPLPKALYQALMMLGLSRQLRGQQGLPPGLRA